MSAGEWREIRAVMLNPGDILPPGVVETADLIGGLRLVEIRLTRGETFTRGFDDIVSVFS